MRAWAAPPSNTQHSSLLGNDDEDEEGEEGSELQAGSKGRRGSSRRGGTAPGAGPRRQRVKPQGAKINWPDGIYYISTSDWPTCGKAKEHKQRCPAPVLSFIKQVNGTDPGAVGLDILIPVPPESVHLAPLPEFPWDKKAPRAFWRGTPFCSGAPHRHVRCSR